MFIFWLLVLVALAIIAGIIGFSRVPSAAAVAGKALSAVFVVAFLVLLFVGAVTGF